MDVVNVTSARRSVQVRNNAGFYLYVCTPSVARATVGRNVTVVANQGITGPPGADGVDAPGATVEYPAGENLSSGRVVVIEGGEAIYFQVSNAAHAGRAYGITTTSALTGETVNLQLIGEASDVAFSFSADSVLWVGADGEIFDTFQTGPAVQKAGVSSGTTKFKIDFSVQIIAI